MRRTLQKVDPRIAQISFRRGLVWDKRAVLPPGEGGELATPLVRQAVGWLSSRRFVIPSLLSLWAALIASAAFDRSAFLRILTGGILRRDGSWGEYSGLFGNSHWYTDIGNTFAALAFVLGMPAVVFLALDLRNAIRRRRQLNSVVLTSAEALYRDTVLLLEQDRTTTLNDDDRVAVLFDGLNDLLTASRRIDLRLERLHALMSAGSVAQLESEYVGLVDRLGRSDDPEVRQAVDRSARMCEARLGDARGMMAETERLVAQQESIVQTLHATKSSLVGMQSTSFKMGFPDANPVEEVVLRIREQNQALEGALEELRIEVKA